MDAEGGHNGASASWGRAGTITTYSHTWPGAGIDDSKMPAFFVPSYLKGFRHADRLEEAYKAKMAAQRDAKSISSSTAGSLSTSSSSINLHKLVPSHRGMTHDIIERAPAAVYEDVPAPLPSRWSQRDKYQGLELTSDGLEVRYTGMGKSQEEAAAVRADHPMPRECGIYYYEVTVASKGKEGRKPSFISIGFSGPKVTLNRLPGWEPDSWAYHGDDGLTFSCSASGKNYGPKYSTGDVIGCGVNFRTGHAFFTKNGVNLGESSQMGEQVRMKKVKPLDCRIAKLAASSGTAFGSIKSDRLYPAVGMKRPNEHLRVNFGQSEFVFDIDSMIEMERSVVMEDIKNTPVDGLAPGLNETQLIHELISQYLAHDGYIETARAFAQEVRQENQNLATGTNITSDAKDLEPKEDTDATQRQQIRAAILQGDIDRALESMEHWYPKVLRNNETTYFKLKCRKFVEMIRRTAELVDGAPPKYTANGSSSSHDDYNGVFDQDMELDEYGTTTRNGNSHHSNPWEDGGAMDTSDDIYTSGRKEMNYTDLTSETIQYGQQLRAEFDGDPRREVKKSLQDIFALIAYHDPKNSPLAYLLDDGERIPVAEELNGAILSSLGKSSSSALQNLMAQTEVLLTELGPEAGASMINLRNALKPKHQRQ
ncbi:ran-binding protein [Venturia nashicola]|nr:ran-binding protein [Venturia nashicola]